MNCPKINMDLEIWIITVTTIMSCFPSTVFVAANSRLYPMVIIPGNGGNQLEIKLNKPAPTGTGCPLKADWHRIWLDVWQMRPGKIECWAENMCLQYNTSTKQSSYQPGLNFRVPGFGGTATIAYLDPSWSAWMLGDKGKYMSDLVKALTVMGYEEGRSLRGAPYDFRFAPHSQSDYFKDLKKLIEDTYNKNNQSEIILLAHSIGGLFGMYFLNEQSQSWKNQYIRAFVPISVPWKGTVLIMQVFASGCNYDIPLIHPLTIRKQQRSYETNFMLLPKSDAWLNMTLIKTPQRNYTTADYQEFYHDIQYDVGYDVLTNFFNPKYNFKNPGVNVDCFYGGEMDTPYKLLYTSGFPTSTPEIEMGPGDGTVNDVSLEWCAKWSSNQSYNVSVNYLPGQKHVEILYSNQLHAKLRDIARKTKTQS